MKSPNPIVRAYGRDYNIIEEVPLNEVNGMAIGVRMDIEDGRRGLFANQCPNRPEVYMWEVL